MAKGSRLGREDLERVRRDLGKELGAMSRQQRSEYLEAATQVYAGLAKMARIRQIKA